ncbi:MAG: ABC transporter ATP-binding protein [Christensenellales bacterium]|jgi:NitT/TauT family transport system ATP-binding protein
MSIRIGSLTKKFGSQVLFDHINFEIPLNKTTVLAGRSGCGKTTLLRMIAGLDKDYAGEITGIPQKISFMFQEDRLIPWRSAKENIAFVLKDIMDIDTMNKIIDDMITFVQLTGHEDKLPENLSGGMKRRVAMARAFCYPASLLLLDEPFKGFDAKLNMDMTALLNRLFIAANKTVIMVNHDMSIMDNIDCKVINLDELVHNSPLA